VNTLKLLELKTPVYFTEDVYIDKKFLLFTRESCFTEELKRLLSEWQFTILYTKGIVTETDPQKKKARLTVAPLNIDQEYIFTYCNQAGEIEALHPDYLNNILSRIIRNHGLRKISPHGFRHTHATLMIELGIDPVNTAKRLGHASSQMTLDTYSHSTAAGEGRTISQFADYLSKNI